MSEGTDCTDSRTDGLTDCTDLDTQLQSRGDPPLSCDSHDTDITSVLYKYLQIVKIFTIKKIICFIAIK